MSFLSSAAIFLGAAIIAVPLFKRLKLGAILGYLIAGVLIGPSVLNFIDDPYTILHFAELGVVLLLFVIGLELEPSKLWRMRNQILISGGSQLIITTALIAGFCIYALNLSHIVSLTIGLALALSSTAFAIQLMNEHRIFYTQPGQQGFSILLMQDVAVIPILLLVASFSPTQHAEGVAWYISLLAVIAVLVVGRFLVNPLLRVVARYGSSEVMTASALFLVLVTALAMSKVGLSMGMGAFIAGILLAESSFKHQLETEIEPFKGLLLGLFFIAIGMTLDLSLLSSHPMLIIGLSLALVVSKALVISLILVLNKQLKRDSFRLGLMLSQGGEFAFVVMTVAVSGSVLSQDTASMVNLVVGLSMAVTSPMVIVYAMFFDAENSPPVYDGAPLSHEPEVIIAGFGRFGQITGRVLAANKIAFTAIDKDAEHIEFVRQFGNKVFYGDATRADLLKKAGIESAKVMLVALDCAEDTTKLVKIVKSEFPNVTLIVRARNRLHAAELGRLEVSPIIREVFAGGLQACRKVLETYGFSKDRANYITHLFEIHDNKLIDKVSKENLEFENIVSQANASREELKKLFEDDQKIRRSS